MPSKHRPIHEFAYVGNHQFLMSAPIPEPYSPPQEDIDYIDNFKCILCHQSL